jgi:hypothetical protein
MAATRRSTRVKSAMPISGARASPPGSTWGAGAGAAAGASNRASSCLGSTRCIRWRYSPIVCSRKGAGHRPRPGGNLQEGLDLRGQCRQHRLEVNGQHAEGLDADAAHVLQRGVHARLLGQFPGLVAIDVFVHPVGQQHHLAQRLAELAFVVVLTHRIGMGAQAVQQHAAFHAHLGRQPAGKALGQEAGGAAGDVDVLAHQVAVDAGDEVVGVEVDVLDTCVELGGDVVTQPFGVQAQLQVAQGADARAAALAHLLAVVDGEKAVHVDAVGHLAAAELQCGRPEQRVEGDDVLADEMDLLQVGVGQVGLHVHPAAVSRFCSEAR